MCVYIAVLAEHVTQTRRAAVLCKLREHSNEVGL